jgi:hypothetical protein
VNICRNCSFLTVSVIAYICFAILQMTIYMTYVLDSRLLFNHLVFSNLSYGLLKAKVALVIGYCLIDQWMTCCNSLGCHFLHTGIYGRWNGTTFLIHHWVGHLPLQYINECVMLSYDGFTNDNKSYFYMSMQILYCQDQFYYTYIIYCGHTREYFLIFQA